MLIRKGYRVELKPNNRQVTHLCKCAGVARFVWNWGLAERQRRWREREGKERLTNAVEQHRELNRLNRTDYPWMYEVSKCVPQEALRNLDNAYRQYWKARKAGRKMGPPRFKKKGACRESFTFTTGAIRAEGRHAVLPRLGRIRVKESLVLPTNIRILWATVSREADRWFVSFNVEGEVPDPVPVDGPAVGVDLGLTDFAVLSDGTRLQAPKPLGRMLRKLRRESRRLSRKQKGSNNRRKQAFRVARLHYRIRCRRRDFLHKASTSLTKTKRAFVVENLALANLVQNGRLARPIGDVGWGEFRRMLAYKCAWYGSRLVVAPRFYPSTRMCGSCGHVILELPLSERSWTCPECRSEHDRDLNAARNLGQLSMTPTASSAGSHACGDGRSQAASSGRCPSRKQEANTTTPHGLCG